MSCATEEIIDTDVLVVGAGCAGAWAALRASELIPSVTLVDKGVMARSGTTLYCHDVLAPLPENEYDAWLKEIVEHAEYMSDQSFADILITQEGDRIRDLESFGVPFERHEKGELIRDVGRGHKASRVVLYDGRKLMEAMKKQLIGRKVSLVERVMVTDLLTSDGRHPTGGRVVGAVGIHTRTGKLLAFKARAVVIATGLTSSKLHFTYSDNLTGDGLAMAFRAGAELSSLEFTFNPKFPCLGPGGAQVSNLIQFQTLGAYIVNGQGERFMDRYVPERKERRSTKALLALAMVKEIWEGRGPIYYDMRHFGSEKLEQVKRIIPITMAAIDDAGIDLSKELLPCKPVMIDFGTSGSGGIRINPWGEATLPGLLAGGVAAQFPGCTEFLSGGFIAYCNVFGHRAGERAALLAQEIGEAKIDGDQSRRLLKEIYAPLKQERVIGPMAIYHRLMRKMVQPEYSIVKREETIKDMLAEIRKTAEEELPLVSAQDIHQLIKANEVKNFVLLLEQIFLSSLERKESRITHYRQEYPYRDDRDWLKWTVVKREGERTMLRFEPVPVDKNRIKPVPKRWPSPIQFSYNGSARLKKVPSTLQGEPNGERR